jgi:micrococcal nuclease
LTIREIIITALLVCIAALALLPGPQAKAAQGPTLYKVIDGDTIRSPAGVTHRLMGYDAPETYQARCDKELELGLKAKARLEELIASGETTLEESGRLDRYGRSLSTLSVKGVDVADILILEGLARPYHGRGKREGWC